MPRRTRTALAAGLAVVALGAAVLAIALESGSSATTGDSQLITINDFDCASGWTPPRSGQRELTISNAGSAVVDVSLIGVPSSLVYGELEAMAPGTIRTMTAVIPPGRYSLQCAYSEGDTVLSDTVTVSGPAVTDAHPYLPVTYQEMLPSVNAYRVDVTAGLARLATDIDHLGALVDAGELSEAKRAWLVAHLDYERLGAAYDTFGAFNDEIDGRPNGLPLGVNDPSWTGFLRLERALWHNQPAATVASVANQLDGYVHGLVAAFPDEPIDPNDLSLRTHEILENTLQFQLTGGTDQGSNTGLATALANVEGTQMTLAAIAPPLEKRDPALLASANSGLRGLAVLLESYRLPDGWWTPVQSLSQSQNEVLDGTISSLLETLSPIPDILEVPLETDNP
jgi:iron uptake system EfeUOB component EfeO/EfeM